MGGPVEVLEDETGRVVVSGEWCGVVQPDSGAEGACA